MSMTWVPVHGATAHGNVSIVPREPSALMWIGLIQRRPNSPAKNMPSNDCGNFVVDGLLALYRYTGPAIGDSEPPPNSGGEPASPAYRIQAGRAAGSVPLPVLRN